jgi:hypothetical protein
LWHCAQDASQGVGDLVDQEARISFHLGHGGLWSATRKLPLLSVPCADIWLAILWRSSWYARMESTRRGTTASVMFVASEPFGCHRDQRKSRKEGRHISAPLFYGALGIFRSTTVRRLGGRSERRYPHRLAADRFMRSCERRAARRRTHDHGFTRQTMSQSVSGSTCAVAIRPARPKSAASDSGT